MNFPRPAALAGCFLWLFRSHAAELPHPGALPRSTPEAQGVSSAGVLAFVEAADHDVDAMNSFQLLRHGYVVAEGWWTPYDAQSNHELYSLSKSFTSTAVGIAIGEGRLSLDDEVLKFFPEDAPANPSDNLKSMRVRDLLCMSAGHQDETPSAPDKISPRSFLAHPVPFKPGTHFRYNTPATFMLSAIVQRQTGQSVLEYLRPRLFEPLGIAHPIWNTNFQGVSLGGYGLRVRTEDIARFGQLYLQKGRWNGSQLVPASWVDAATARQTSNGSNPKSDWDQGYGYQFWRCRHGAYRGDGAFGQYCLVLPEHDAVIAITSGVKDMQAVLNLVWEKLLPALENQPLPADSAHQQQLDQKLRNLSLRPPAGPGTSPTAARIIGRRFQFTANEQKLEELRVDANPGSNELTLSTRVGGAEQKLPAGLQQWAKSRGRFGSYADEPLASRAAWSSDDTLIVKVCAVETPFYRTHRLRFEGDQVTFEVESNVGFGSTKQPALLGHAE